ncbi:hypothetical protein JEQ12_013617 [Ovis aries]|uniref:Uncharacterized protein n=1 Tax=Ovis aries TaxID=9940 RepID=A0A836AJ91_SHEEP|nr:hypothetical protein JEQ12_013617 [Ovis aries]
MGAGGAASHSLAWASLPQLGPPAGALCEDTLYCRGVKLSRLSHMDTVLLLSCPPLLCKGEINFDLNLILTEDD